jgi:hypothetical protein
MTTPSQFGKVDSGFVGRRRLILPLAIAVLGFVINVIVATSMAETFDEPDHIAYGAAIIRGHPDRFTNRFDSKMPVSALNAFPHGVGIFLQNHRMAAHLANILRDMRAPRYGTIAAAFCLCRRATRSGTSSLCPEQSHPAVPLQSTKANLSNIQRVVLVIDV